MTKQWSRKQATDWHKQHPWWIGCNYTPRNAISPLEMWQSETFSPDTIREELGWAASLGFNTARIFLHDLAWAQDPKGFLKRVDKVFDIARKHKIGVMPVFFDSCWHPFPHVGKQPEPEPGVHNSGWVQSPGVAVLRDEGRFNELEKYVTSVVGHFADDKRVQIWDVWNEPDNPNAMSYGPRDLGEGKGVVAAELLPRVFKWVRSANPTQPLTSGIWLGDWSSDETLKPHERIQLELSDVISFHCYGPADDAERRCQQLKRYGRPMYCTEYMSRASGSTFDTILPVFKKYGVGAYNWGFVAGKTQTNYPWDSWQRPYPNEPELWFHDIFRGDGSAYREEEVELIRNLTDRTAGGPGRTKGGAKGAAARKPSVKKMSKKSSS
jgi:hypothetical protein